MRVRACRSLSASLDQFAGSRDIPRYEFAVALDPPLVLALRAAPIREYLRGPLLLFYPIQ